MRRTWVGLFRRWWNLLALVQVALGAAAVAAVGSAVLPVLWEANRGAPLFVVRYMQDEAVSLAGGDGEEQVMQAHRILSHFEPGDGEQLTKALPKVVRAAGSVGTGMGVAIEAAGRRYLVGRAALVSTAYLDLVGRRLVAGSFFTQADARQAAASPYGFGRSAVITQALAKVLFGSESAVGQQIAIRSEEEAALAQGQPLPMTSRPVVVPGQPPRMQSVPLSPAQIRSAPPIQTVTVIGVVESPSKGGAASSMELNAALLLPAPAGGRQAGQGGNVPTAGNEPIVRPPLFHGTSEFYVRVRPGVPVERAKREIAAYFAPILEQRQAQQQRVQQERQQRLGQGRGLPVSPADDSPPLSAAYVSIEQPQEWIAEAAAQGGLYLGIMALAAVLVSGIAVFTVTLVNLSEQRREIGLLRALGATRSGVWRRVAGQALVLVGLGAGLGVVLSEPIGRYLLSPMLWMGSAAATDAWQLTPYLDLRAALLTLLLALGVGLAAVSYPGWEAARIRPVDALRDQG